MAETKVLGATDKVLNLLKKVDGLNGGSTTFDNFQQDFHFKNQETVQNIQLSGNISGAVIAEITSVKNGYANCKFFQNGIGQEATRTGIVFFTHMNFDSDLTVGQRIIAFPGFTGVVGEH